MGELEKQRNVVSSDKQSSASSTHREKKQYERSAAKELGGENAAFFCREEGIILRENERDKQYGADGDHGDEAAIRPDPLLAAEGQGEDVGGVDGCNEYNPKPVHFS